MAKGLLQNIVRHQWQKVAEIHWKRGRFTEDVTLPKDARYVLNEGAVYEQHSQPDGTSKLSVQNALYLIVRTTNNIITVWLDENLDPIEFQGVVTEFAESAPAISGCPTGV